eukprot:9962134-Lingulodinium_polyedra.AAC.1
MTRVKACSRILHRGVTKVLPSCWRRLRPRCSPPRKLPQLPSRFPPKFFVAAVCAKFGVSCVK